MNKTNIVLSGTMRSGTTLMGSILNAHSQINIVSDKLTWYFKRCYKKYGNMTSEYELDNALYELEPFMMHHLNKYSVDELRKKVISKGISYESIYISLIELELNREISEFYGIKTTHTAFEYKNILDGMPNSRIIHMVRNVNDVYHSHNKFVGGNKNILFNKLGNFKRAVKFKIVRFLLKSDIFLEERIYTPYHFKDPIQIIDYWSISNRIAIDLRNKYPENILIVRFEDLINNVELEMRKVVDFLGVEWENSFFEYNKLKDGDNKAFKANTSFIQTKTDGYDKSKIGQSKLTNYEKEYLMKKCILELKELSYE